MGNDDDMASTPRAAPPFPHLGGSTSADRHSIISSLAVNQSLRMNLNCERNGKMDMVLNDRWSCCALVMMMLLLSSYCSVNARTIHNHLASNVLPPSQRKGQLRRAHSHNDYHQADPLYSALRNKIGSIEVDVFPSRNNDKLLVGHTILDLDILRTIDSMYLAPLLNLFRSRGKSLPKHILLLVDFKGNANRSIVLLHKALSPIRPFLSHVSSNGKLHRKILTIVISGNRPDEDTLTQHGDQIVFLDGRIFNDADVLNRSPNLVPLISISWQHLRLTQLAAQHNVLKTWTQRVHANGKQFRVWGAPNREDIWQYLEQQGVDWINIDDHARYARFAAATKSPSRRKQRRRSAVAI